MTDAVDTLGIHGDAVPAITADQMREKLLTIPQLRERLAPSEPITPVSFLAGSADDRINFVIQPGWAEAATGLDGDALVNASVIVDGTEHRLTKDALLEATSICGIQKSYAERCPSLFIEPELNFWFKNSPEFAGKEYQVFATGEDQRASAIVKGSVQPFSNLALLDRAIEGIQAQYPNVLETDMLVDYKMQHSLRYTKFSLIIPESSRVIERTGTDDDSWSAGLSVVNSLIGAPQAQTEFAGYLFRWWCTNGAIDTRTQGGGRWSRKKGQGDEVYEWARETVNEILGGMEHLFDQVQQMVDTPVDGAVEDVLNDIFAEYKLPNAERQRVIANMLESNQLNMYAVMQAITQVANREDINPGHMDDLMRIGGDLPHTIDDRCDSCHRVKKF